MYDMKNLGKLKTLEANAPDAMKAYRAFDTAMSAGAISAKNKQLMALAVAFTTQCPYCIEIHSKRAREAGASEQEISEVVFVAAAFAPELRPHTGLTHSPRV
jgi:AhpD family alkylhydroperoxidase